MRAVWSRAATFTAAAGMMVAAGAGGAVAAGQITGHQIKDHSIHGVDVHKKTLGYGKLTTHARNRLRGAQGPVGLQGPAGATGATGQAGPPGTPGAVRAFGQVDGSAPVIHQSGGITVTNPAPGRYCLHVPGVSGADTVAVVAPNYYEDSTVSGVNTSQTVVEYNSGYCSAPDIGVNTFKRTFDATTHDTTLTETNEGFSFVIP